MQTASPGGIDQVRVITSRVDFDQAHPRARLSVPNGDSGIVEEILLSINGWMNPYITVSGVPFRCPESVMLSIIGRRGSAPFSLDITESLVTELGRLLDAADREAVMSAYKVGMNEWLQYADAHLQAVFTQYNPSTISSDKQRAIDMCNSPHPSTLLNKLGDRSVGISGTLHIFNYLYRFISLPAVSLKGILAAHSITFSELSQIGIECQAPIPGGNIADLAGSIFLTLEVVVHNPLRDQLADLQKTITQSLNEIDARLSASGAIVQSVSYAQDQLTTLQKTIDDFEAHLTNGLAEIRQLQLGVSNVSAKIDGIK